ncbi:MULTISPECIES: NAD(P)-dependent oxidoreductase [Pseudonocardia]|uniref:2-hydroxy-3-oxopropionate reductase n=2 Tax=Pseudonocardia TaxID=1847 RepID=A0A1Y2MUN5_PSEAH|nr:MULTISPECIES: NAD(P)-binding domain-containing protein [Pseudonocardia]OSY38328.1 2-hydroxy-3-oxopropionate reductase [Pseudonocardia autotrophica]TDN72627.1 3-hydroxyisobutyrate dehydrogenase-like beta-hydroxyacid dehydrogenase [Pseudonocardia autotrophica]BBG03336.1 oxidoreductase [Pseudonocardia autotrophica]GEC24594.1 oxidoreductase [Pseudonocardia saturnea]
MTDTELPVTLLGTGAMGRALAGTLLDDDRPVTLWNRTPGRAADLLARGATGAATVREAVAAGGPVVVCLLDHAAVHATLDPVADALRGRTIVNLTTSTPAEARELASWSAERGIAHLDGAIMATPPMIGGPGAQILYSGSRTVFDAHRELLDRWAASTYDGADAGRASLLDLAMLAAMYSMFTGFLHGAAMVRAGGVTGVEFAERATPFLAAMTESFAASAAVLDSGDFSAPPQSLDWTGAALDTIGRASREQGVDPAPVDLLRALVRQQIDAGHGADDLGRIAEGLRVGRSAA